MNQRIYLDCDGVLADFDSHYRNHFGINPGAHEGAIGTTAFWKNIRNVQSALGGFYRSMRSMPDAHYLVAKLRPLRPIILTGCPMGGWAESQKIEWAAEHFPGIPMVCCMARNKSLFCEPGDVLIDDRDHYRDLWEGRGGIFIHHKSARESLDELVRHGIS